MVTGGMRVRSSAAIGIPIILQVAQARHRFSRVVAAPAGEESGGGRARRFFLGHAAHRAYDGQLRGCRSALASTSNSYRLLRGGCPSLAS